MKLSTISAGRFFYLVSSSLRVIPPKLTPGTQTFEQVSEFYSRPPLYLPPRGEGIKRPMREISLLPPLEREKGEENKKGPLPIAIGMAGLSIYVVDLFLSLFLDSFRGFNHVLDLLFRSYQYFLEFANSRSRRN